MDFRLIDERENVVARAIMQALQARHAAVRNADRYYRLLRDAVARRFGAQCALMQAIEDLEQMSLIKLIGADQRRRLTQEVNSVRADEDPEVRAIATRTLDALPTTAQKNSLLAGRTRVAAPPPIKFRLQLRTPSEEDRWKPSEDTQATDKERR